MVAQPQSQPLKPNSALNILSDEELNKKKSPNIIDTFDSPLPKLPNDISDSQQIKAFEDYLKSPFRAPLPVLGKGLVELAEEITSKSEISRQLTDLSKEASNLTEDIADAIFSGNTSQTIVRYLGNAFPKNTIISAPVSTIPLGGGIYKTPPDPANPWDKKRWTSAFGNDLDIGSWFTPPIKQQIILDECNIGLSVEFGIGPMRLPKHQIMYRRKECREPPPPPPPPRTLPTPGIVIPGYAQRFAAFN
ncbi:MAG: hypothetical protein U7123_07315 [Potamolinea sp.]